MSRKSKNKVIGNEGKKLVNLIDEIGGYIMNGTINGDKEGEFTYIGYTVIGYVIVNEICNNNVIGFKVDNRINSGHLPLELVLRDREEKRSSAEEEHTDCMKRKTRIYWDDEVRKNIRKTQRG